MKFGRIAVAAGEGLILAHAVKGAGVVLRKGEVIGAAEIAALEKCRHRVGDRRAARGTATSSRTWRRCGLPSALAGRHVTLERPFTGRCNLLAEADGLVLVDAPVVDAVNAVDEAITLATVAPMQPAAAGEMVATVKIIPFAVGGAFLDAALVAGRPGAISVAPFLPLRVGVVSTLLPALKRSGRRQDPRHPGGTAGAGPRAHRLPRPGWSMTRSRSQRRSARSPMSTSW